MAKVQEQTGQRYWPPPTQSPYPLPDDVYHAELGEIAKRREQTELNVPPPDPKFRSRQPALPQDSLVGLALSGGGIRSATFSLGVLQALASKDLLRYVDYLSTVSGGGFIGSSLTWLVSKLARDTGSSLHSPFGVRRDNFPYGVRDPADKTIHPDSQPEKMLDFLRKHGNYLTPGKGITLNSGIAVIIRGALLNLLVWLPVMTLLWLLILYLLIQLGGTLGAVGPKITEIGLLVAGLLAALFVVASIVYSLLTYRIRRDTGWRYPGRRLFERCAGWGLGLFVTALVIAALPHVRPWIADLANSLVADESTRAKILELLSYGGPGFIVIGLAVGYFAYQKLRETILAKLAATLASVIAIILVLYGIGMTTFEAAACTLQVSGIKDHIPWCKSWTPIAVWVLIAIAIITGWVVNVNYIALHRYYRDRLMETFMPDINSALENRTGPAIGSNSARVSKLWDSQAPAGPYHLVNTNLILVDSENPIWRSRKGDNFVVAPMHCGGNATGWRTTDSFMSDRLTLATSMAISGAAANPNAGVGGKGLTTNPLVSLMLALLNFRLGNWVPNPIKDRYQSNRPNHFRPGLYHLLKLLFHSGYRENRAYLQLSDGGHFENTAIYELIRRRARLIILCDGGGDKDFTFSDLQDALRRIGPDFQAAIDFEDKPKLLIPDKDAGYPKDAKVAEKGHLMATITYHDGTKGKLIMMKTTLIPGLSMEVLGYKGANPDFPDETTADQFFSEAQVEAYRELGYRIAKRMIEDGDIELERLLNNTYFPATSST